MMKEPRSEQGSDDGRDRRADDGRYRPPRSARPAGSEVGWSLWCWSRDAQGRRRRLAMQTDLILKKKKEDTDQCDRRERENSD